MHEKIEKIQKETKRVGKDLKTLKKADIKMDKKMEKCAMGEKMMKDKKKDKKKKK